MILARRQFLSGSAALVAASAVRAQTALVTPEQFGAVGDLRGDSGTDDTAAFRAMAAHLNATGGRALVSRRHRITGGFALYAGALEFTDDALVRNTTRDPRRVWPNTCLFVGTYFGVEGPTGLNGEPQVAIFPIAEGADRFRVARGRMPAGFAPGALVYLKDGRKVPGARYDFRMAAHVATIAAIDGDTVILREPTPLSIGGSAGHPPTSLTPSDALPIAAGLAVPAPVTRLARGVRVINGAFESAQLAPGRSQTVHVACHDCELDFRWLSGSNCLGINPCSDSAIAVRDAEFTNVLYELAYFHARVRGGTIRGARIGTQAAGGVPPVSITEYGHSVDLGLFYDTDRPAPGDADRPTVAIATPFTSIETCRVANAGPVGVAIGPLAGGTRIGALAVAGAARVGVRIDADAVAIGSLAVGGMRKGARLPLVIGAGAGRDVRIDRQALPPGLTAVDQRPRH
jgi:hypothetical protein